MTARYLTCEADQFLFTMPTEPTEPTAEDALDALTQPCTQPSLTQPSAGRFEIVDYSERAVAIFGDTFPLKDELRNVGAKFNRYLKDPLEPKRKIPGWILSKRKLADLAKVADLAKKAAKSS